MNPKREEPPRPTQQDKANSITIFVHTIHTLDSVPAQLVLPSGTNVGQAVIDIARLLGQDPSVLSIRDKELTMRVRFAAKTAWTGLEWGADDPTELFTNRIVNVLPKTKGG